MSLYAQGTTHTGFVRDGNEDAFVVEGLAGGLLLAAVADGLGGHQAGEVASAHAVRELERMVRTGEFVAARDRTQRGPLLKEAAFRVHEIVAADAANNRDRFGMATTLTAVLAGPEDATLVQVGDSRCYRWHDGCLDALSVDQTVARELFDAGEIDAAAYATHPERNLLSQCLGVVAWDMPLAPVLTESELDPGDRLLLCSDGLTDMVDDAGIAAILARGNSVEASLAALQEAALAAGGRDNVTVVLVEHRAPRGSP